jgi:ribosomal protein S18 acetylase RimI-like enzyme
MHIETVTAATFEQVLPLIADYQRFYEATPDEARNRAHFGQLLEDHDKGIQFVALDEDQALGFATIYFPLGSVSARVNCLMNDLYTIPAARGQGIGRALILHCLAYARDHGFSSIYWQTAQTNARAQQLYDSLPTTRSAWYTYTLATPDTKRDV